MLSSATLADSVLGKFKTFTPPATVAGDAAGLFNLIVLGVEEGETIVLGVEEGERIVLVVEGMDNLFTCVVAEKEKGLWGGAVLVALSCNVMFARGDSSCSFFVGTFLSVSDNFLQEKFIISRVIRNLVGPLNQYVMK